MSVSLKKGQNKVPSDIQNNELIRYDLGEDFSIETAIVVGELYRNNNE